MIAIAALFLVAGIAHFVVPAFFVRIMPPPLAPWALELTYISGVFEILGAIGLLLPKTRVWAAYGLMVLLVAVYPANIYMALDPAKFNVPAYVVWGRLPLQFVLLWWLWRVAAQAKAVAIESEHANSFKN